MTATNGSPSPKPRSGRHHRYSKSGSSLATPGTKHYHHSPSQNVQAPYYLPISHHHHQNNHAVPRANGNALSPPQTPKAQGLVAKAETSHKRRKNRGRPGDGAAAANVPIAGGHLPGPSGEASTDRMTPPKPSTTPLKAYAGPLFHSSPNPSALPVPKFFSKSVPATPAGSGMQAMMESEDSEDTSGSSSAGQSGESHLQRLFRADKEEKDRLKMKRQSSGSSSSNDASPGPGFDRATLESHSFFGVPDTLAPRAAKPIDGIFPMDMDKPTSPAGHPSPARTSSAPSQFQTTRPKSEEGESEDDRRATAKLLKQYLLSPAVLSSNESTSPPFSTSTARKPQPKAGPPLTPTRNNQNHSHSRSVTGFSPSDQRPRSFMLNGDFGDSMVRPTGVPSPSPLALRGSPFQRRDGYLLGRYAGMPKRDPALQKCTSPQSNKSIFASKLEAANTPSRLDNKTVADMENDLRRVLNLDVYAARQPGVGHLLI